MSNVARSALLFAAGGDVFQKYGTLTRRYQIPQLGGEGLKEVFTRTGTAWSIGTPAGFVVPAAANTPRLEYLADPVNAVVQPYLLLEAAAANIVLRSRDMTNAVWTKTTMTPALDQVGADGVTNAASSLLATAGNATCLQAITLASSTRFQTAYIKRLVGSGAVHMTTDGGGTWTTIAVTTAWARYSIPSQLVTNPSVGFRLVTNADKIAVDFVQNEGGVSPLGTFQTSVIPTTTVAITRNADSFSVPFYVGPSGMWIYVRFLERGTILLGSAGYVLQIGSAGAGTPNLAIDTIPGFYEGAHQEPSAGVGSHMAANPAFGQVVELLLLVFSDGSVQLSQSINGAAEVASARSSALAFGAAFSSPSLYLNSAGAGSPSYSAFSRLVMGTGPGTLVSTIADARSVPV